MSNLNPLPEFIKFNSDPGSLNFTLQTDDVANEGFYTLVFVKTFDTLQGAHTFATFLLDVKDDPWVTNVAPYF